MLYALHETINIMTLGGLALAVGILVDDATVEIENINRNLESGKEIEQAILDGAAQIATPALVSTLAICIVFVPMFLLSGVARYLFVPLAEAVVFAMLASYLLSRTVVPTMAKYLLKEHDDAEVAEKAHKPQSLHSFSTWASSPALTGCATATCACSRFASTTRGVFLILFLVFAVGSVALLDALARTGFLSLCRCRPVQDSRARPHRHAHRRDRRPLRSHRRHHPPAGPFQRTRHHPRQRRPAQLLAESFLLDLGPGGPRRRRHPGPVDSRPPSHRGLCREVCAPCSLASIPA